ncbi:MAG TPA: DUF4197 domain-containing protein [Bacteroidia bacterium]|nr:DUF4197 domain-containing protein [Bacteroidia bacterium]
MKKLFFAAASAAIIISSCDVNKALDQVNKGIQTVNTGTATPGLTSDEIIKALKDALTQGTNKSTAAASQVDGFNKNPKIHIPFPPAVQNVKDWAVKFGLQGQVDKFEETLNHAAEEAAKGAAPIFIDAVTSMTISDGLSILKGTDTAATHYLREKCTAPLNVKFKPTVHNATQKVELTKYWTPIMNGYNKIPGHTAVNPDLDQYVCDRGIDGLFKLIGDEEAKIRIDPMARATDIMKKVFGSKENPHNH